MIPSLLRRTTQICDSERLVLPQELRYASEYIMQSRIFYHYAVDTFARFTRNVNLPHEIIESAPMKIVWREITRLCMM